MYRIVNALFVSVMLSIVGCAHSQVIPDPTIPHQVSREAQIRVWIRTPDGKMVEQSIRLLKGWWVAGPPVVEAEH